MTTLEDLLTDIDAAFEQLLAAGDESTRRRALRAVIGAMFETREVIRIADPAYFPRVAQEPFGRVAEGIMVIRGRLTHGALNDLQPAFEGLYPGPNTFPGPFTYPGQNLTWRAVNEIPQPDRADLEARDKRDHFYRDHVGGSKVLSTLDAARSFFKQWPSKAASSLDLLADHADPHPMHDGYGDL